MATEYYQYKTLQSDTFDSISLDFYNTEKHASIIMNANPTYIKTLLFSSGITLKIPVINTNNNEVLPPWKRS